MGRWRNDLTPDEAATVSEITGDLLVELGYTETRADRASSASGA